MCQVIFGMVLGIVLGYSLPEVATNPWIEAESSSKDPRGPSNSGFGDPLCKDGDARRCFLPAMTSRCLLTWLQGM